nr:arginine--tRNA ligase, chloroplastic/mitochondrial-like isoform X2 [Tanacetum cinerariifolium]
MYIKKRTESSPGKEALNGGDKSFCLAFFQMYTFLKNHRLVDSTFNFNEMVNEEGNTFVYLLNRLAKIHTIMVNSFKDIEELQKASDIDEGLEGDEERVLEFHLLKFTEASRDLEESYLCVLPHILCEYLYQLSKKFTNYYLSSYKVESVVKISTLLMCEAVAVVMEKCFYLCRLLMVRVS